VANAKLLMTFPVTATSHTLAEYRARGGYGALEKALKQMTPQQVIAEVSASGIQGRGGAAFPMGRKWGVLQPNDGQPHYLCANADEGEPGTFKDRWILEFAPHLLLESMLIASYALQVRNAFVYIRGEFDGPYRRLAGALEEAYDAGYLGEHILGTDFACDLVIYRGAGSYVCGEASALITSIEGKRGYPRNRPPYIAEVGLFGRPTLNQNVETLHWVPKILAKGAKWFADQGVNGAKGLRSWSVSGRIKKPGVIVAPAGITCRELIDLAGGVEDGQTFKAYLPGGASGGILPASLADLPLDFGTLDKYGSFVGSHAIVIFSERDDIGAVVLNLLRFFKDESCGQCTPCRVGCDKAVALLERDDWDAELLNELAQAMRDASICGLGQAAPNAFITAMEHFSDERAQTGVASQPDR
jgi:formate dehydrogenase